MKPTKAIWKKLNRRGEKAKYNRLYRQFKREAQWLRGANVKSKLISILAHNLALLAVWDGRK